MSQVNNFRALARNSAGPSRDAAQAIASDDLDGAPPHDLSFGEKVRHAFNRFVGVFVSIFEVSGTALKIFFMSLPILGPIGLIVYNMDFKGATQKSSQKSIAEQLGISEKLAYAGNLFKNMDKVPLVLTTAAGLVKGGKGELPEAGEPDLKSLFDAELPKGALPPAMANLPEEPTAPAAAEPAAPTQQASAKKAAVAPKLSPATIEKNEAAEVMGLLNKVEADYRIFPQADAAFAAFMQRNGKSKFRAGLQRKRDDVARIAPRAMPERAFLSADSRVSGTKLSVLEAAETRACLAKLPQLNSVALVRKSVTIQSGLPAYVALADFTSAKDAPDAGERLAMSRSLSVCFSKRIAAGTLSVMFWSDPATKQLKPVLAQASASLVFVRG